MRGLTVSVVFVFALVSALTLVRWATSPDPQSVEQVESPAPVPGSTEPQPVHHGAVAPTREALAAEGSDRKDSEVEEEEATVQRALRELCLALDLGFSSEEALALAHSYAPEVLAAFFAEHSHIDADWLHRNGLSSELLPELYARWATGAAPEERSSAPGNVLLSRYTPRLDGGPYRAQQRFHPEDRTVFLHYSLPERYQSDAVLVRWVREKGAGKEQGGPLQHFDRHHLSGDIHQRQEAWMRPARGWEPGDYRVDIFSADADLQLLASESYRVD